MSIPLRAASRPAVGVLAPALTLALSLALAACKGDAPPSPSPSSEASAPANEAVLTPPDPKAWVRSYLDKELGGGLGTIHVDTARYDLDGDGTDEVLAYASGAMMCGTGGCDLLVLKPSQQGYTIVGDLSVVQLPVGVLASKTNGWHDLAVSVSGGGEPSSIRRVPFGGTRYASNPTTAGDTEPDTLGTVLLSPDTRPDKPAASQD